MEGLEVRQINLQHSISGSYNLMASLAKKLQTKISLIQEPYIIKNKVTCLSMKGWNILYKGGIDKTRTCIAAHVSADIHLLADLSSGDLTAAMLNYGKDGGKKRILIVSAYLPYDSITLPPTNELVRVVDYAKKENLDIIIGCDANSHHENWGSTNINSRGQALLEYLANTELEILNTGGEHTFVTSRRQETMDITLCSRSLLGGIRNWKVSSEASMSDHRYIDFLLEADPAEISLNRNPRKANWQLFRSIVMEGRLRWKISKVSAIDQAVDELNGLLTEAFERSCPQTTQLRPGRPTWWNKDLEKLRKRSKKLLNKALKTREEADWASYSEARKLFKRLIRKSKKESYEKFCESIEDIAEGAALIRVLKKDPIARLGNLKISNDTFTTSKEETYRALFQHHFPDCDFGEIPQETTEESERKPNRLDWIQARRIVWPGASTWAIKSFEPYKAPGPDGIWPIMIQECKDIIEGRLENIFTACIAFGYVPKAWRSVRVAFIPKPGKINYSDAKSFRPISLSSCLLKCLERLIDRYIRNTCLKKMPLSSKQHAYQAGKSTDTVLLEVVSSIEEAISAKEIALGGFLDIEGAFDKATFESLLNGARRHGVNNTILSWIRRALSDRWLFVQTEQDTRIQVRVKRGCPQGGVLSPLLWNMMVDELLDDLNEEGWNTYGFADDVCILLKGANMGQLCRKMQGALDATNSWCRRNGLTINASKTQLVAFTNKRKLGDFVPPVIGEQTLMLQDKVKYLGITLDKRLNWATHVEIKCASAMKVLWQCRRAFGNKWGLTPKMVYWLYKVIVRPIVSYGSIAWVARTFTASAEKKLEAVQRLACLCITSATRTTPTAALQVLLGLPPLHLYVRMEALKTTIRLGNLGITRGCTLRHHRLWKDLEGQLKEFSMPTDDKIPSTSFRRGYEVHFPTRENWSDDAWVLDNKFNALAIYTDGSLTEEGAGAGVYFCNEDLGIQVPLGRYCTVFQAEVFAINLAAKRVKEQKWSGKVIKIFSDSQAALKALDCDTIKSKIVEECSRSLNFLGLRNHISLEWIPGHSGQPGNEKADELAKSSAGRLTGPEPAIGISKGRIKFLTEEYLRKNLSTYWRNIEGCRVSKIFLPEVNLKTTKFLLSLSRSDCRMVVGLMTGHNHMKKHMVRLGIENDPTCRYCLEEDETSPHVLGECLALARLRIRMFGAHHIRTEDLCRLAPSRLLAFYKKVYNS